jgi:hypothetical protein
MLCSTGLVVRRAQLSAALVTNATRSGICTWQFSPPVVFSTSAGVGQVKVGFVLSFTVNVTTQVSLLAGDALSVTVTVTGMVMPSETPL